jgi:RNA polymerase sigma-70 factor (ECF subfamily)
MTSLLPRGADTAATKPRRRDSRATGRGAATADMADDGSSDRNPARFDGMIVAIATRRDSEAFAELFAYFAPRIKTFMLRSGASAQVAEEVAQEALLTVWRKADLYDPASSGAATWIFAIARNLRIDVHRRERGWRRSHDEEDVEAEFRVDEGQLPDQQAALAQSQVRVRRALERLSDEQARVVELSFFDEKAHAEIARDLGLPLGTVKSRLRLAMARLRELLRDLS